MSSWIGAMAASVTTFAATNIDDLFLLTLFFASQVPTRRVLGGQYLGFSAIIILSLTGAWAALALPHQWIRFLGILPLAIGIRELLSKGKGHLNEAGPRREYGVLGIATVTLSKRLGQYRGVRPV